MSLTHLGDDLHERELRASQSEAAGLYRMNFNGLSRGIPADIVARESLLRGTGTIASRDTLPAVPLPPGAVATPGAADAALSTVYSRDESRALDLRPYGAKPFDYPLHDPLARGFGSRPGNTRLRDPRTAFFPQPMAGTEAPKRPAPACEKRLGDKALVTNSSATTATTATTVTTATAPSQTGSGSK